MMISIIENSNEYLNLACFLYLPYIKIIKRFITLDKKRLTNCNLRRYILSVIALLAFSFKGSEERKKRHPKREIR